MQGTVRLQLATYFVASKEGKEVPSLTGSNEVKGEKARKREPIPLLFLPLSLSLFLRIDSA